MLVSGCATKDIISAEKCQWVREKGSWTYAHYSKCNNPEHKEGISGGGLQRYGKYLHESVIAKADKIFKNKSE